jgi:hypothetical protein
MSHKRGTRLPSAGTKYGMDFPSGVRNMERLPRDAKTMPTPRRL